MEQKKNCKFCSKEIEINNKAFCNMECYRKFMIKPKEKVEIPKQEMIIINKADENWLTKFFSFLSGK